MGDSTSPESPDTEDPTLTLPADIHIHIIDQLRSDKETLQNCAMVCMDWLSQVRRHLFKTVTISPVKCSLDDFCLFLIEVPNASRHIQELVFNGYVFSPYLGELTNIFRALQPRLKNIHFVLCSVASLPRATPGQCMVHARVVRFGTFLVGAPEMEAVFCLLSLFGFISHLDFDIGSFFPMPAMAGPMTFRNAAPPTLRVRHLTARNIPVEGLVELIRNTYVADCLVHLRLDNVLWRWEDIPQIGEALPKCRKLETLELAFAFKGPAESLLGETLTEEMIEERWSCVRLSRCPSIKNIVFHLTTGSDEEPISEARIQLRFFRELLRYPPSSLLRIIFSICFQRTKEEYASGSLGTRTAVEDGLDDLNWHAVEAALCRHDFPRAATLVVYSPGRREMDAAGDEESVARVWHGRFPMMHEQQRIGVETRKGRPDTHLA